jgi:hypothetical protein
MEVLHPAAAEDGRRALPRRSISPKMSPTCENLSGSDDDITAIETGRRESRGGSAKTVPFPGAAAGTRKSTGAARLARQRSRTGFSPFPRFAFFEVGKTWDFFCLGRSAGLRAGMNFRHEPKCAETHAKIPVGREGRGRLRSARGKSREAVNFVLWADVMTHFGQYFGLYFSTDALFTACK